MWHLFKAFLASASSAVTLPVCCVAASSLACSSCCSWWLPTAWLASPACTGTHGHCVAQALLQSPGHHLPYRKATHLLAYLSELQAALDFFQLLLKTALTLHSCRLKLCCQLCFGFGFAGLHLHHTQTCSVSFM